MSRVGDKVATQLYAAAQVAEEELDDEIERLDKLTEDDLEELRRKRLEQMKNEHIKKKSALATMQTGSYEELKDEKEFFEAAKKCPSMVCVFYRGGTGENEEAMKKHMDVLSKRYWGTRFCRINAEKSLYLAEKLHIWMLPSIVLIKEGKTEYTIRGFDEMGGRDFETERLEALLSMREVIPKLD